MNAISPKIEPRHLSLRAVVYVRQSTARQVLVNQESTRRGVVAWILPVAPQPEAM